MRSTVSLEPINIAAFLVSWCLLDSAKSVIINICNAGNAFFMYAQALSHQYANRPAGYETGGILAYHGFLTQAGTEIQGDP